MTESKTARKSMVKTKDGSEVEMTLEYALKELRIVTASGLSIQKNSMVIMLLHAYDDAVMLAKVLRDVAESASEATKQAGKTYEAAIQLAASADTAKEVAEAAYETLNRDYQNVLEENNIMRSELATIRATAVPPTRVIMATYPPIDAEIQS